MTRALGGETVPRDMGLNDARGSSEVNVYMLHDAARWKDLNPKFVRVAGVPRRSGWRCIVYAAIAYMNRIDRGRDG